MLRTNDEQSRTLTLSPLNLTIDFLIRHSIFTLQHNPKSEKKYFHTTFTSTNVLIMAKKEEQQKDDGNLLAMMLEQADGLDFSDPFSESSNETSDPRRLMVEGFE